MRNPILCLLCFCYCIASGQALILTSGNKEVKLEPGQWLECSLADYDDVLRDQCYCPSWIGKLIEYSDDSVRLQPYENSYVELHPDGSRVQHLDSYREDRVEARPVAIAARDIRVITLKGNSRKPKENTTLSSIGLVLVVAGTGGLAASPAAENTGEIALLGLGELVAGIILGMTGTQRKYYLTADLPRAEKKRIWEIQRGPIRM